MRAASVLLILLLANPSYNVYSNCGVVVEVASETVTFCDPSNNLWEFEGTEDWQTGDLLSVIMCDNGTLEITDDYIVGCPHYLG